VEYKPTAYSTTGTRITVVLTFFFWIQSGSGLDQLSLTKSVVRWNSPHLYSKWK